MNFFGHAAVAVKLDGDPRFVLGAMLPDFASMSRTRIGAIDEPRVAEGVRCHHRTDDVFHGAAPFRRICREGARELEARGVGPGPAAAVAHVGAELLLDGLLLERAEVAAAYRAAVALRGDVGVEVRRGPAEGLRRVRERLRAIDLPDDYRSPVRVTARLAQILAHRPRLALQPGDAPRVRGWLERTQRDLPPLIAPLVDEVAEAVREAPARGRGPAEARGA